MATQATSDAEIVVMKFGGTSVAGAEQIKRAAARIVAAREEGKSVVAVLSARGKTTDELAAMAKEVAERPDPREMDMLLSTGERISCALCAMAIVELGHKAISLTGSQAGIVTDSSHTKARILDVRADRIREALEEDSIVLVAGFQGVSTDSRDVTTLGRGGSDTTAVAVAAALGARGLRDLHRRRRAFTAPTPGSCPTRASCRSSPTRRCWRWRRSGAKVLQLRSVEYARNHGVQIHCRSSSEDGPGTLVVSEQETMERPLVTAVTHSTDEARVTLTGVRDEPGVAGRILRALADANVNVDMIIQNEPVSNDDGADLSFTVESDDLRGGARGAARGWTSARTSRPTTHIGKVSIVGAGMRSHPGVAAKVFEILGEQEINIEMISTSPIKISCVIAAERGRRRGQGPAQGLRARRGRDPAGKSRPAPSTARRSAPRPPGLVDSATSHHLGQAWPPRTDGIHRGVAMDRPIATRILRTAAGAAAALALLPGAAVAATINVDTTADEFGDGSDCSLREAIQAANANANFDGCAATGYGADTVAVPDGIFDLTRTGEDDTNSAGDLDNDITGGGGLSSTASRPPAIR